MPRTPRSEKTLLSDMRKHCSFLTAFTAGRTRADFESDMGFRLAIERALCNIGEALWKLEDLCSSTAAQIPEHELIIRFRHILVHNYADLDNDKVWNVIEVKLEPLIIAIDQLLSASL